MNILFLDIDGVLNNPASVKKGGEYFVMTPISWDPICVAQLRRICEITKCKIVITSVWRLRVQHVYDCFNTCFFAQIIQ